MKAKIQKMIGNTFMHGGKTIFIKSIIPKGNDMFKVISDASEITADEEELITDFLPVANEGLSVQTNAIVLDIVQKESDQLTTLGNILMDNITKVQADPKYIDQARAINENAKNLIDIKKTQIEMLKLLRG